MDMVRRYMAVGLLLITTALAASASIASRSEIDRAITAGDYEGADQLIRKELQTLSDSKTAEHAALLHEHATVLKHLFNFTQAQKEEAEAGKIEDELKKPKLSAPSASSAVPPNLVIPPPPAAAVKSAKAFAKKNGLAPAASPSQLNCDFAEARYTVHTAVGDMDCHLFYNGKGLLRMMNESDPSVQFAINYPSLKTRILKDESVNKGKAYSSNFLPCDAPPYMDERGATTSGAQYIGKRTIDGHPCSGWQSSYDDHGLHFFNCEMWFAQDLHFPYRYIWAMKETPQAKVTWELAVFNKTPKPFVFDLSGYKDSGSAWDVDPWFRWLVK